MLLDIHQVDARLDDDAHDRLTRRLDFALARLGGAVRRVAVYLRDENGPRGGVDLTCRVVLDLRGVGLRVVEDRGDDLPALIDRVAGRAGQVARRELSRRRTGH